MESWLASVTHDIGLVIEAMAVLVIAYASASAFVAIVRLPFRPADRDAGRAIWLRYLRWLVAALTFQLAADLVHTAIAPTWEELGHVAAIAAIRTFLNFFLERDLREQTEPRAGDAAGR